MGQKSKSLVSKNIQPFTFKLWPGSECTIAAWKLSICSVMQPLSPCLPFSFIDASSQVLNSNWPGTGGKKFVMQDLEPVTADPIV